MSLDKNLMFPVEQLVAGIILQHANEANEAFNVQYPTLHDIVTACPNLPVEEASAIMQRVANHYTVSILKGKKLTDFNRNLYQLIETPGKELSFFRTNVLKYLISVDESARKAEEIDELGYRSVHVGEVGQKLSIALKILRCSHVHSPGQYDFYSAIGITRDGNLFNFSPKGPLPTTNDYSYRIACKVKSHHVDEHLNGFNVTRVNYCKELTQ